MTNCMNLDVSFRPTKHGETLKKGRFLVIDPCYVFQSDSLWKSICDACNTWRVDDVGHFVMTCSIQQKDFDVFIFKTRYGDGIYPVFENDVKVGECGVDAGLLSFIPAELISVINADDGLGVWVSTQGGAYDLCKMGDVSAGSIRVMTSDFDDD